MRQWDCMIWRGVLRESWDYTIWLRSAQRQRGRVTGLNREKLERCRGGPNLSTRMSWWDSLNWSRCRHAERVDVDELGFWWWGAWLLHECSTGAETGDENANEKRHESNRTETRMCVGVQMNWKGMERNRKKWQGMKRRGKECMSNGG